MRWSGGVTAAGSCEHRFGEGRVYVAHSGPMEGTWVVRGFDFCNTLSLKSRENPDGSIASLLAALTAKGCAPREAA
jgi:hypothetical protein